MESKLLEEAEEPLAHFEDVVAEMCNICADPDKPVPLDPLRRDICLEYIKRAAERRRLQSSLSLIGGLSRAVDREAYSKIDRFLTKLVQPFLSYVRVDQRKLLNCYVKSPFLVNSFQVESHGIVTIPLDKAISFILGDYLECGFIT